MYRVLLFSLALILFVGCGGDDGDDLTGPEPPSVTGGWSGSSQGIDMTMSLSQTGTDVTGDCTMSGPTASINLSVSGSFSNPALNVTMTNAGYEPATFVGTLNGNTITGTINGSGFQDFPITLNR